MNCPECLEVLAAFLDLELAEDEFLAVQRHLVGCAACAAERASLRRAQIALRSWGEAGEDPDGLLDLVAELRLRVRRLEQDFLRRPPPEATPASGPLLPAAGAEHRLRLIV